MSDVRIRATLSSRPITFVTHAVIASLLYRSCIISIQPQKSNRNYPWCILAGGYRGAGNEAPLLKKVLCRTVGKARFIHSFFVLCSCIFVLCSVFVCCKTLIYMTFFKLKSLFWDELSLFWDELSLFWETKITFLG
jgi:hypothetical protein